MPPPSQRELAFASYLERLVAEDNRAALAALRRGLSQPPGAAAEIHRYVVPWLPRDAEPWREEAYYLVAALFASHPLTWPDGAGKPRNLGASFGRLARETQSVSNERRFVALLNTHPEDLPARLRHVIALLKSRKIPVDWAQLLHDIQAWAWESRAVQREWARVFWGAPAPEAEEQEQQAEGT